MSTVGSAGCHKERSAPTSSPPVLIHRTTSAATATPAAIPDSGSANPGWVRPGKDFASSRFSALDQITTTNVGGLRVAFTFSTGVNKGHEAPPLVVGGSMYLITPYPNVLYALDLTKPGAPPNGHTNPSPSHLRRGSRAVMW